MGVKQPRNKKEKRDFEEGQVLGSWTIIEEDKEKNIGDGKWWKVQCKCGKALSKKSAR